jgi:hypothetical protein
MFASLIRNQRQFLEITNRDYFPAGFCPFDEPLNLCFRPATACVITCSSEGFGRFAKASRVATIIGWVGSRFLFMPLTISSPAAAVKPSSVSPILP